VTSVLERSLGILELLAAEAEGLPLGVIASRLDVPPSAAHRLLGELARFGYVRQDKAQGSYALTIKLAAMGLSYLGQNGISDVAQPILDRLAAASGELIRLSVLDGSRLTWVAVAQGATGGLRYDPGREQGQVIHLASTAGGRAWLATLSDEEALTLAAEQGFAPDPGQATAKEPAVTAAELLRLLAETRARGYSVAVNSYILGMAAMGMPVRAAPDGPVIGAVSIAGPAARMTAERMAELAPLLAAGAAELGQASRGSRLFGAVPRDGDAERRRRA
jgi:IclR family acetate operon transcriptional repressor